MQIKLNRIGNNGFGRDFKQEQNQNLDTIENAFNNIQIDPSNITFLDRVDALDSQKKIKASALFDTVQTNHFNERTVTNDFYLVEGKPMASPGNCYSDYIQVVPGSDVWATRLLTIDGGGMYDINLNYVQKITGNSSNVLKIPSNIHYIRINISPSISPLSSFMVVYGLTPPSTYRDYHVGKINGLRVDTDHLDGTLLPEQMSDVEILNMFDPTTVAKDTYVTNNGSIIFSSGITLSRYIKVKSGEFIGASHKYESQGGYYTSEKKWMKQITLTESETGWFTETVPAGAEFVRVNVLNSALTTFMLTKSSKKPTVYSPYRIRPKWLRNKSEVPIVQPEQLSGIEVLNLFDDSVATKEAISNTGVISPSEIIKLSRLIVVNTGETLGCNYNYAQPGVFLDDEQRWIKKIDFTEVEPGWFATTVPENARYIRVNVVISNIPNYILKKSTVKPKGYVPYGFQIPWAVMTTNKLLGLLVATFGDSITWLDGKTVPEYDNGNTVIKGYQYYMRKAGAIVDNFGHSGATIARSGISGVGCILDDIKAQDVTKYEIITIAGGTNDVGQNVNFGVIGVEEDTNLDETTTFGALRAAIEYIRSKNPKCRIYICTPIRSGRDTRTSAKMEEVSEGIRKIAKMYSCPLIDMLVESGIGKGNYATFLYDLLHPNNDGFRAMGEYFVGQMLAK